MFEMKKTFIFVLSENSVTTDDEIITFLVLIPTSYTFVASVHYLIGFI